MFQKHRGPARATSRNPRRDDNCITQLADDPTVAHIPFQIPHARRLLPTLPALTALALLSACNGGSDGTATPPASATDGSGGSVSGAATPVPGAAAPGAGVTTPAPGTVASGTPGTAGADPTQQDGAPPVPVAAPLLADPEAGTVVGAPGTTVDCADSLPCRWVSADSGVAITAGAVDHLGTQGELTVDFALDATRDSAFTFAGAASIDTSGGATTDVQRVALGPGNGVAPVAALAGEPLVGRIVYDDTIELTSLPAWSLTLVEAGQSLDARFANLPVALPVGSDVDCAGTLPCTWQTADADVLITLTRVGGFATAARLDIGFRLQSTTSRTVAMDAGSSARAAGGFLYTPRTHRLGTASGFGPVSVQAVPGQPLDGRVDFFRATTITETLSEVQLDVFEDGPVPRWRPTFLNVPSIAP